MKIFCPGMIFKSQTYPVIMKILISRSTEKVGSSVIRAPAITLNAWPQPI